MKIINGDIEAIDMCKSNELLVIMDGDFPEWLLTEVLVRLPVKFIFRLKLVCKHWLSVISDPSFVRMYTSRVSSQSWVTVSSHESIDWFEHLDPLQRELRKNIYSRELKCPSYLRLHYPSSYFKDGMVCGISNGLVLHYQRIAYASIYCIYNPVTWQWMSFPPLICPYVIGNWGFLTQVEDGMLQRFRVVCILWSLVKPIATLYVFFSESGEWKNFNVKIDQDIGGMIGSRVAIAYLGNLHWLLGGVILAYDPYHKPNDVRFIPLPLDKCRYGSARLCGVSDGKLRYFGSCMWDGFSCFDIWVLHDDSSGDWSLQHRIEPSDLHNDSFLFHARGWVPPILFDPFDSNILYLGYENFMVSYNCKTKIFRFLGYPLSRGDHIEHLPYYKGYELDWLTGLLLLIPPWPTYIPTPPSKLLRND